MILFVLPLCLLPTVLSTSQNQCILFSLQDTFTSEATTVSSGNDVFQLIKVQPYNLLNYIVSLSALEQAYEDIASCSGVIGAIGDVDSETAAVGNTITRGLDLNMTLVSFVAPTTNFLPLINADLPNVLDMNPLTHYLQMLTSLTDQLKWTRVALVSDDTYYYQSAAELLQKMLFQMERPAVPHIRLDKTSNVSQALHAIQDRETRVIIIFAERHTSTLLLEKAHKMNMMWPSYGWLVLDPEVRRNVPYKFEKVILIQDFFIKSSSTDQPEINSSAILDSISAVTLAHKGKHMSFEGRSGLVKFNKGNRLSNISAVQVVNGSEVEIARYDSNTHRLTILVNISESASPRGSVLITYSANTIPHIILFSLLASFSAVLVTVMLVLYLLFRKEPEVKATSVPISISMFIGCYLQLSYIPVLLVKSYPDFQVAVSHKATCQFIAWLGGTGIPFPLILVTILVKMLRVYAIFLKPLSYKKKFFTDHVLLLYIVILLSPTILILTLWSSIDPLVIVAFTFPTNRGQEVTEFCLSTNTTTWLIIPYVYQAILIAAVVIIGFKTSSIRSKHFQDASATNTFVIVAISAAFMGTVYGYLFSVLQPSTENYLSSEITLSLSSVAIVIACQMLLFFPKVYSPVKRFITRDEVKEKPTHDTTNYII